MAAVKNHARAGGRPPGSANKATTEARAAISAFVDGNAHRLQEWLDRIAVDSPEKAFTLFQSVIEYHVPRLARTEMQNLDKDGNKADPAPVRVEFVTVSKQ